MLPCNHTVAVLVTVRNSDHRNASVRSWAVDRRSPAQPRPSGIATVQRGLPGLGVYPAVVLGFDPGREQPVELQQRGAVIAARRGQFLGGGVGDFDE